MTCALLLRFSNVCTPPFIFQPTDANQLVFRVPCTMLFQLDFSGAPEFLLSLVIMESLLRLMLLQ